MSEGELLPVSLRKYVTPCTRAAAFDFNKAALLLKAGIIKGKMTVSDPKKAVASINATSVRLTFAHMKQQATGAAGPGPTKATPAAPAKATVAPPPIPSTTATSHVAVASASASASGYGDDYSDDSEGVEETKESKPAPVPPRTRKPAPTPAPMSAPKPSAASTKPADAVDASAASDDTLSSLPSAGRSTAGQPPVLDGVETVPGSVLPTSSPIKPVSSLLKGSFELASFKDFVRPPSLPSVESDDEDEEDEDDGKPAVPLSREALIASFHKSRAVKKAAEEAAAAAAASPPPSSDTPKA